MDFLTNTEILLAMLIVPAALALDWAIRNGNLDDPQIGNQDEGYRDGPQGYGYYYRDGIKSNLFNED